MNEFTTLIKDSLEIRLVRLPDEEGDGPLLIAPSLSNEDAQVAVFTGENATGKSLFADGIIRALAKKAGLEGIIVNMKYRTGGGIRAAFMFGDETNESTGYISARTMTTGFSTCEKRTIPHLLILDEPEIGLSPKYQAAMGKRLNTFCNNLPELTKGVVICTHSKILVRQLNIPFHFLRFGDQLGYSEWIEQDDFDVREEDLETLLELGINKYREISKFLQSSIKENNMAKQPTELGLLGSSSATGYTFNTNDQDISLGGLVKAEASNGFSVFGIVTNINSSPDATGKALAKAGATNASALVNSAAVNRSLDVSVTTVGYLEGGKLFRILPPRIPPALSKIVLVEGQELESFTDDGSYINGLMNGNFDLPIDAIISTSLYQGFKARGDKKGATWLSDVVRRLITVFRGDYKTLTRLLSAVGDLLPDNLQDNGDEAQQIGHVIGGDMNLIQARLTVPLGKIQEGSFVVIEDERMRVYAMLSQLKLGTSSPDFVTGGTAQIPDKVKPLLIGDALYADIEMMPVLMQRDGIASKVTAVKTLPKHFSAVSLANAADIRLIYGDPGDPKNFVIGNTREQGHPICLDMEKFVQRSSGIFGATGTGKSFLTRLILAGLMHFNQASILVLDMHNEYGYDDVASDTGKKVIGLKSKYPDKVKIVGVGAKSLIRGKRPDFNLEIASSDINIEDILLLKEELDLNDTASAVLESLKESFGTGWYRAFQAMTPGKKKIDTSDPKNHKEVMDPSSVEYWARSVGVNQISAVSLRTKIIRLFNKKYINTKPAVNSIAELVRLLQTGHHVVLSFGDYSTDLDYLLICNVLTRLIRHEWEKRSTDYRNGKGPAPRPLVITVEEAHKLLTPTLASQTSFGTIAREMRKFFVTLLVVDQRPSQISTEVMSQLGTRVSGWLGDEDDIHNILTGLPGREALRGMIARLEKKEEVLCMGWGVPVPTPVRTTIYNDEFWKRLLANPMGKAIIPDLPKGEVLNLETAAEDETQMLASNIEDNESAEDIMSTLGL